MVGLGTLSSQLPIDVIVVAPTVPSIGSANASRSASGGIVSACASAPALVTPDPPLPRFVMWRRESYNKCATVVSEPRPAPS